MKNIIYVLVISLLCLTIFSCAKKSDTSSSTTTSFAPPTWIQGAWVDNVSSSTKNGWKFDSSDMYQVIWGTSTAGYVAAGITITELTSTDSEFSYSYPQLLATKCPHLLLITKYLRKYVAMRLIKISFCKKGQIFCSNQVSSGIKGSNVDFIPSPNIK